MLRRFKRLVPRHHLPKPERRRRRRLLSQVACSSEKRDEYRIHGKKENLPWRSVPPSPSLFTSFLRPFVRSLKSRWNF